MKKKNDLTFKETIGNNNKFSNKGITLIALVITIIVLLILAGVTIATLTGNDNLFKRAEQAEEETKKGEATEKINLKITNMQISSYAENEQMPTLQYLADGFCKDKEIEYVDLKTKKYASLQTAQTEGEFLLPQIDAQNAESIFVKLIEYPYEFEINKSLQLASIDGIKLATNQTDENNNFSKEDQIVGTWIDGEPLYRKMINIDPESSTGVKHYTIDIANVDYITVDESHSYIENYTDGKKEYIPIKNIWDTGNTGGFTLIVSESNIEFQWYRNKWQNCPAVITFEYTKKK